VCNTRIVPASGKPVDPKAGDELMPQQRVQVGTIADVPVPRPHIFFRLDICAEPEMVEQTAHGGDQLIARVGCERAGGDALHTGIEMHILRFEQVEHAAAAALEFLAIGGDQFAAFYWVDNKIAYVISGPADRERLETVTKAAYEQVDKTGTKKL